MKRQLVLTVTYKCNLNCSYCPTIKKNESMNWKIAKRSLELFNKLHSNCEIKFFGGEPLLEFNLIKKIVSYNKKLNKKAKYELTTNGILLDKKRIRFFKKNNFELRVSIDGDKETQISERGTKAWQVFNKLKGRDKEYVVVNMVASPKNMNKFYENFAFLSEHGFKNFNILPAFFNKWSKKEILIFNKELKKIAKFVKKHKEIYIKNKDINNKEYLFNDGIIIDTNGDIYNTNKVMINQYSKFRKQLKLGSVLYAQDFKEMGKNIKVLEINSKDHAINLILDRILTNFVESL